MVWILVWNDNLGIIALGFLVRCQRTAESDLLGSTSEHLGSLFLPLGRISMSYLIKYVQDCPFSMWESGRIDDVNKRGTPSVS